MRKINKICSLSTVYKKWEEELEANNKQHPKYDDAKTRRKYYWDIAMQLHACQGGLCAYTEQEICDDTLLDIDNWQNGIYRNNPPSSKGRFGELDHFDERLKSKKTEEQGRKDWQWNNLFMIQSDINKRKGTKAVDNILKPDREGYDPYELLEYDIKTHVYRPNRKLSTEEYERVETMIEVLCMNDVTATRRKFLSKHFQLMRFNRVENDQPEQFPTAYEMYKRQIKNQ